MASPSRASSRGGPLKTIQITDTRSRRGRQRESRKGKSLPKSSSQAELQKETRRQFRNCEHRHVSSTSRSSRQGSRSEK